MGTSQYGYESMELWLMLAVRMYFVLKQNNFRDFVDSVECREQAVNNKSHK